MRDLVSIHSDNRRAAILRNDIALYHELINLIGKVKAAGWKPEQFATAERLVEEIEFAATGRKLDAGVPAGYAVA
jgi:hypothetical protein